MIDRSPYARLASGQGRELLHALEGFAEERAAAAARAARRLADADLAAAALSTTFARRRAALSKKFPAPETMLFTREGYEQASSHAVARHRAARYIGFAEVVDLCCGIGSDAIAIAGNVRRVRACDVDIDVLACAIHNAAAVSAADRIDFTLADALEFPLDGADAAFADPSRRSASGRARSGDKYLPPLASLLARASEMPGGRLGVKVAPGLDFDSPRWRDALRGLALEVELVSERGVCKEAVLWCGSFARKDGARRASVIDAQGVHVLDGLPGIETAEAKPDAFVGEPDPAVIRAGLIGAACAGANAAPIDLRVAYVTSPAPQPTPFIRWYKVRDILAFSVKRLREHLRERGIGELVVKTRAFPLTPEEIADLLKAKGDGSAVVICTTLDKKKTAIVCEPALL